MPIKLNIEKVYDGLDWMFVRKCSLEFGFSDQWIECIMECIITVSLTMLTMAKQVSLLPQTGN